MPDFTPRPTVYKGIKMRSRLEAGYAQWLDSWRFEWEYEPQAFANESGQYLPDFKLSKVPRLEHGVVASCTVYVEVKPSVFSDFGGLARRMDIITSSVHSPEPVLMLEMPGQSPRAAWVHADQVSWLPLAWAYDLGLHPDLSESLTLVMALYSDLRPWPHGYWNGPS